MVASVMMDYLSVLSMQNNPGSRHNLLIRLHEDSHAVRFEIKNRISVMGAILFSILKAQNINAAISVLLLILPLKNLAYR